MMMFGGGLMLLFGLLFMLLVVGLPVLLIVGVFAGGWRLAGRGNGSAVISHNNPRPVALTTTATHNCVHCSQTLQSDWTHCPHCGAPV